MEYANKIIEVLGSLGVFFFGLKLLSEAILSLKGERLRQAIKAATKTRLGAVATGVMITSIIQSSSATTVLVVSFVHARLLKLKEAVGVIMGANLGTTFTFWAVAILGFKFKISGLYMPAIAISIPLLFSSTAKHKQWGGALMGFGLVFMGLDLVKGAVPDIKSNPEGVAFLAQYTGFGFGSVLIFILVGIILTVVVQSSHASGAITLIMAYRGWIDFPIAAAIIMGENIGTTITAYLASMNASASAKRASRAHFLFNAVGVVWMLAIFGWFTDLIEYLVPGDTSDPTQIPQHLAAFHTAFNLANICLLIFFVPQLTKLAYKIVPDDPPETKKPKTLILEEAAKQIQAMTEITGQMFHSYKHALNQPTPLVHEQIEALRHQEDQTNKIQEEVSARLQQHSFAFVNQQVTLALADLRILDYLESVADHILELANRLEKKQRRKITFPEEFHSLLVDQTNLTEKLLQQATEALTHPDLEFDGTLITALFVQFNATREFPKDMDWADDSTKYLARAFWRHLERICRSILLITHVLEGDLRK